MTLAVHVSHADSGELWVLRLDPANGAPSLVQRVMAGGQVMPMAVSPDRRFLYVARRSDPLEVLSFAIDPVNGELAPIGAAALPDSMAFVSTDRSGRWLFSASYGGNLIAVSPIDANGVAGPAHQVLPTAPNAHAIAPDPSNRHVYATSLGGGHLARYRFDATRGMLSPADPPHHMPHENASPRHFVFSRDARFVYLLSELDARIDVLAVDPADASLHTLQTIASMPSATTPTQGRPWAADLHLTPDGGLLYSSERRSNTLAAFRVDAADGTLTLIGHAPTEAQPRSFAITPDGRFLISAGQRSNRLEVSAIDAQTGALQHRHHFAVSQNPSWVECVELPIRPATTTNVSA